MEYQKQWNRLNKDKRAKYSAHYNKVNKDKINARNRVKVVCSCGTTVSKGYHNRHVKRPIHQQNLITIRSAGIALPPPAGGT